MANYFFSVVSMLSVLFFFGSIPLPLKEELTTKGVASYYHSKFGGRRTASGEIYHQDSLTAAHKTLPFGTFVKIVNLKNDSSVILRINDRLPKSSKRMIDVSRAAAIRLNFIRAGIASTSLEIVR